MGDGSLAKKAVSRYLELINARRYSEIGSLFSDDAQFLAPTGEEIRGRESIRRFYASGLERISPTHVWACSQVTEGDTSIVEISATLADEPEHQARTVLDHFTVNAQGEITRMAVYMRPAEALSTMRRLGLENQRSR